MYNITLKFLKFKRLYFWGDNKTELILYSNKVQSVITYLTLTFNSLYHKNS